MDVFKNTINEYNYNILKENNLIDILSNATLTKGFCDLILDDYIMMLRESKITSISIDEIEDSNDIKLNKINDIIPEHSIVLIYKNDYLFDDDILYDDIISFVFFSPLFLIFLTLLVILLLL